MALGLPLAINPGDPGHLNDHEALHAVLNPILGTTWQATGVRQDTLALRPLASAAPQHLYRANDVPNIAFSDGVSWIELLTSLDAHTFSATQQFDRARFKTQPFADVTHTDFAGGASGDGVTDDTAAIQAAIDAVASAGGGIVFFPEGTFITGKLTLKTAVQLLGSGVDATILRLADGTNDNLIEGENFATLILGNTTGGIHSWSITYMTLDGNKAGNGGGNGIGVYGYDFQIAHVRIRDCPDDGIESWWSTALGAPGPNSMEAHLHDVIVHECGNRGIYWNGPHDSHLVDVICYENTNEGFFTDDRGGGTVLQTCHSWGNAQIRAFRLDAHGTRAYGCFAEGASIEQVRIGVNNVQWIDGDIRSVGGSLIGVNILNNAAGYIVHGIILNCAPAIAFTADGGLADVRILANAASGAATSGTPQGSTALWIQTSGGLTGSQTWIPEGRVDIADTDGLLVVAGGIIQSGDATKQARVDIAKSNGTLGLTRYITGSLVRFETGTTATPETGAGVGSDYVISRFDDAGAFVDIPILVTRSTGNVTMANDLNIGGDLGVAGTGTVTFGGGGTFAGDVNITGQLIASTNVRSDGTLDVNGAADILGQLVGHDDWITSGDLQVSGTGSFGGQVMVTAGGLTVTGPVFLTGNTDVDGRLRITGAGTGAGDLLMLDPSGVLGFYGAAGVAQQGPLTAQDGSPLNSGDAATDGVIGNNRTRIAEIEAAMTAYGLL